MKLVRIGRDPSSDVHLQDNTVSRRHAEIVVLSDQRLYLSDCGSTSGTLIEENGTWVPVRQTYITDNAQIKFGDIVMTAAQVCGL